MDQYLPLLDNEELETYYRYKVDFKKHEFLAGRVLTKTVLAKYLEIKLENISFTKNKYGKLFLENHYRYKNGESIYFNISHSNNMIVCAVTLDKEIGVDVEKVNGPILEIAERFFAPKEKEYISTYKSTERNCLAYRIWTLKEAYIKSKGEGLSISLESFDVFSLGEKVFLKCIEPKSGYYLSIAIDNHRRQNFQTKVIEVKNLSKFANSFEESIVYY